MAKQEKTTPAVGPPGEYKPLPIAHVTWPAEGIKLAGNHGNLGLGKGCRIVIDGKITGFRMDEYGGSVDLRISTIRFERVSETSDDEDEGVPFADLVKGLRKK